MPGRVVSRRFVGRESEHAQLLAALDGVARGRAATVAVTGTAGIGVTRFVDDALERIAAGPIPPLVLRGVSHGPADAPYAAVLAALEPALVAAPPGALDGLAASEARAALSGLPVIADLLGRVPAPRDSVLADPERRQPRALEALVRWLGRASEERPILLVLEDLHVADAATRAFATFVSRIAREERIGLLLTWQPDRLTREHPLRTSLAEIEAGPRPPARIDLGPLGRRDIAGLIEGIEGERPSASVVVLVAERSMGSPLVAEELVAARRELHSATLTGTLADLVSARLARRSPECRRALRLLAPAERPMSPACLAETATAFEAGATSLPPRSTSHQRRSWGALDPDLAAGLAEAQEHGLVRAEGPDLVGIRHELIARAVVADILPPQRPRYHAALAAAFAHVPVVAAAHWRAAYRLPEARAAAVAAADVAAMLGAPEDALAAIEMALELRPPEGGAMPGGEDDGSAPDAPSVAVAELERQAADLALAARRYSRAVAYGEAALAMVGERKDRLGHALLEARLGRYRLAAGDADGAAVAMRRAADVAPAAPTADRARILALLAQERMIAGAFRQAERAATEALAVCASVGPEADPEAVHATTTLGVVRGWGDRPEEGVRFLEDALARATELGLLDERFRASANLTTVLDLLGRREEAVEVAYRGIEQARAAGLQAVYGNVLGGNVADSLFWLGRWDEARELSLRALDWSPEGVSFVNAIVNLVIVEIESAAGEEAGRLLGRILVELETGRDVQFAVPAYQATASLALWSGDLADARRAVERGWARLRGTEDWVLVARMAATALEVEAALVAEAVERRRLADLAAARERAARVLAEATAAVTGSGVAPSLGSRREAEAHLATARAYHRRLDGHDDPGTWASVASGWEELGDRYRVARARWRQAEALLAFAGAGPAGAHTRTDARVVRADAREPLLDAVAIALALGARPLLRELRELAGRALIALPPEVESALAAPVPSAVAASRPVLPDASPGSTEGIPGRTPLDGGPGGDTFGLSRRELEVLAHIAQGRTNREIGDRLFISQKTVGVHVGNILAKLGVSGRVEAAAVAIRLGLGAEIRTGRR
jgi:DNA-binding CsgD family transcriptional regulator/tetratricopeptide (TPR) repeat protein